MIHMGGDKTAARYMALAFDNQVVAGQALTLGMTSFQRRPHSVALYAEIGRYGAAFLTTMPVMTGPVRVFKSVKNFCSSFSRALAT